MITYSCTVCKLMLKGVKTFLVYMGLKWSVKVKTTATNNTQYSSSCKDDRCHSDSNTHTTPQNNNVRHVHNTCTYHRIHYIFNCHTCRLQCIVIYHIVQWKTKNSYAYPNGTKYCKYEHDTRYSLITSVVPISPWQVKSGRQHRPIVLPLGCFHYSVCIQLYAYSTAYHNYA